MRKAKYFIPLFILFLTIGFATVNQTLSIKGSATNQSNIDDFTVYFSDVLVNDVQDLTLVKNENELVFTTTLEELGNQYKITYDITNGSKYFDAAFVISCTQSNNYLKVTNQLDTSNLPALETRTGNLTLEKTQTNAAEENTKYTVTCTITATPVERETTAQGEAADVVAKTTYFAGEEITIGTESFNVISQTDTTVTMLARYNIGLYNTQTQSNNYSAFTTKNGWEYTPGPKEIDIQTYSTDPKNYINKYVSYLQTETGDTTLSGDLITLSELGQLGCTIPSDYDEADGGWTCINSVHKNWLINSQDWWTRSASPKDSTYIWFVKADGNLINYDCQAENGIRPTITISKEALKKYV